MTNDHSSRVSLLKAIGIFAGATFFAYLFSILLHEFGHYLVSVFLGVPEKGIVLNPFGKNYNIYLGDLTTAFGTPGRRIASGVGGAVFDLLVSVGIGWALWRKRSPGLLPLLAMGGIALLHESVNMAMGALKGVRRLERAQRSRRAVFCGHRAGCLAAGCRLHLDPPAPPPDRHLAPRPILAQAGCIPGRNALAHAVFRGLPDPVRG